MPGVENGSQQKLNFQFSICDKKQNFGYCDNHHITSIIEDFWPILINEYMRMKKASDQVEFYDCSRGHFKTDRELPLRSCSMPQIPLLL